MYEPESYEEDWGEIEKRRYREAYEGLVMEEDEPYKSRFGDRNCDHDMEYPVTLGLVGGRCRKCGYSTM